MRNRIAAFITIALLFTFGLNAQKLALQKDKSSVTITGTSSLHDWHEEVNDFDVTVVLNGGAGSAFEIKGVSFSCRSASVTSNNSIMTDKTLDALRASDYPEITFTSATATIKTGDNEKLSIALTGQLGLNGVLKLVSISAEATRKGDTLIIEGSAPVKMSDFNIKPPTAIMGTLKTGNEVVVHFDLVFITS